jgi:hypothetical protein
MRLTGLLLFALLGAGMMLMDAGETVPILRAHAHNDYLHEHPLLDALDQGFCSVEADVFLIDGRLLVAHDADKVQSSRTLQSLYLDPLRERVRRNGGRVYAGHEPSFTLLIDVKSDAEPAYRALKNLLENYADMLTRFRPDSNETKAVTVIISGNRARETMSAETSRLSALDGRLADLDGNASWQLIPLVSDNWTRVFKWKGQGALPVDEKNKLKEIVAKAHHQQRRIRFWSCPDNPSAWRELCTAGVDLINTDKLSELGEYLRKDVAGK